MMPAPSAPPDLQAMSGFEEGSFTAMLPGKAPGRFWRQHTEMDTGGSETPVPSPLCEGGQTPD